MNKQIIKNLEIDVSELKNRVSKQEHYVNNTTKLSRGYAREVRALGEMKEQLKLTQRRLSNAHCQCF